MLHRGGHRMREGRSVSSSRTLASMRDTSPEISQRQIEIYRAMTPEQRLVVACELTMFARSLSLARIRSEHPDWSDEQAMAELARIVALASP